MTHPQALRAWLSPVDERGDPSTPWGPQNVPPIRESSAFSTIHTAYYCYSSYLMNTKKS